MLRRTDRAVAPRGSPPVGGPVLLRLQVATLLAFPAYLVVPPFGAVGGVAQLMALGLLVGWVASLLLGRARPGETRHPGRAALLAWLIVSCLSYAWLMAGLSGPSDVAGRAAADRWLVLVFAGAGVSMAVTQGLRTRADVRRLVGWLLGGSSVCGIIAVVQSTTATNPLDWVELALPGLQNNGSATIFQPRQALLRVAGTTMHPIELGVVSAMVLPLAVWWGLYTTQPRRLVRWLPAVLALTGCLFSLSRSGLLALAAAAIVVLPNLPATARRWALVITPAALAGVFLLVPGMISTQVRTATAGQSDPSIVWRTNDYPLAWALWTERPVLGHGPGTWMPTDAMDLFDNQYLFTAVTMGTAGLVAMMGYFLVPALAALQAARRTADPELRLLGGSVAAALLVALVSSATFDSLSFPTFALLAPVFVGLSGTVWLMVRRKSTQPRDHPSPPSGRLLDPDSDPTSNRSG